METCPVAMNVLYLVRTYVLGGPQTIVRMLIRHLPKDEFNIFTVSYEASGSGDYGFIEAVRSQGDDVAPERVPWQSRASWFKARRQIGALIHKYRVDLIHTHDNLSNVMVGLGRRRWPCACLASAYGWFEPQWNLKLRAYYAIERHFALPQFDRVCTVSQDMQRKIAAGGTPAERLRVINTGIDAAQLARRGHRDLVRQRFGIPREAVVVGTVSRLAPEKGHSYLLRAMQGLAAGHPRLFLLIVGTGPQRGSLEAEARRLGIAARTRFTGFCADLAGAFEAMDIFAFPSVLDEGFPTSVLEAQAAGLPVVASDIGGTREAVEVGTTALLARPRDPAALAEALSSLLADDRRRELMGAAARSFVETTFTQTGMINAIAELYRETVAASKWKARASGRPGAPVTLTGLTP